MQPELAKYLRDMLDAVDAIEQCTLGLTEDDFLRLRTVRDAAQWNLCVIGEAVSQLKKRDEAVARGITDHAKMVGLRNQLIHGYGVIDNQITWKIIIDKLPILRAELEALLAVE